jgi:hypothetical protein
LAVALFIPPPPSLHQTSGQALSRPGIFLVYDLITNLKSGVDGSDPMNSSGSRIWCFLPFNILFGFASALFTFWINGSVASAAGACRA